MENKEMTPEEIKQFDEYAQAYAASQLLWKKCDKRGWPDHLRKEYMKHQAHVYKLREAMKELRKCNKTKYTK